MVVKPQSVVLRTVKGSAVVNVAVPMVFSMVAVWLTNALIYDTKKSGFGWTGSPFNALVLMLSDRAYDFTS